VSATQPTVMTPDGLKSGPAGDMKRFVGRLAETIDEAGLSPIFEEFGSALETVIIEDKATGNHPFLLVLFDLFDALLKAGAFSEVAILEYANVVQSCLSENCGLASFRAIESWNSICCSDVPDKEKSLAAPLLGVLQGLERILKSRPLPSRVRFNAFQSLAATFETFPISVMGAANVIAIVSLKLAGIEIQLFVERVISEATGGERFFDDRHECVNRANASVADICSAFYVTEAIISTFSKEADSPGASFPAGDTYLVFQSIHQTVGMVLDFIEEMRILGASGSIKGPYQQSEDMKLLWIASCRLLGEWMSAEPFMLHSRFVASLEALVEHVDEHVLSFIFPALLNLDIDDWVPVKGMLPAMLQFMLRPMFDVPRQTELPNSNNANNAISCVSALLTAACLHPSVFLYHQIFPVAESLESSYLEVHRFRKSRLEQVPLMLPPSIGSIVATSVVVMNTSNGPPLLNAESDIPNAHAGAHHARLYASLLFYEALELYERNSEEGMVQGIEIATTAGALLIRMEEAEALLDISETELWWIWCFLARQFVEMAPSLPEEYLLTSENRISLWYRVARVLASAIPMHPRATTALLWALKQRNSVSSKGEFLPPPPKALDSEESDAYCDEDRDVVLFFRRFLNSVPESY